MTRFGAPAVPTPQARLRPNSAYLETMPEIDGIQSLSAASLLLRLPPCRKNATRICSWSRFRVNPTKLADAEVVPPAPDHAGRLSIRLGERAVPLAGPQDRPIDPSFWGRYRPSHENTLFNPFWRACSANTLGPIAPKQHLRPDCAQPLQTSRPCPKARGSQV